MKSAHDLLLGCPIQEKVKIKIKGYRIFKADEVRLRYIACLIHDGKLKAEDVKVIDRQGSKIGFTKEGRLERDLSANTITLVPNLIMHIL